MRFSRREFLGGVTGVAAGLATMARSATRRDQSGRGGGPPRGTRLGCVLLDLQDCCGLRESLTGYEAALSAAGVRFVPAALDAQSGPASVLAAASVVIVPGCARLHPTVVEKLAASLESGARVLLESGAAFAAPTEFAAHRRALKSQFRLEVDAPVDLWPDLTPDTSKSIPARAARGPNALRRRQGRVPYVDYAWPVRVRVRDFSRVVPLADTESVALGRPPSHVVAWVDRRPVAVRKAVGKGTLVFLGSPLGPALRAGDREARRWLSALLSLA